MWQGSEGLKLGLKLCPSTMTLGRGEDGLGTQQARVSSGSQTCNLEGPHLKVLRL